MGIIIVIACLLVIGAMILDLIAGLYKAKQRGEIRSSWGLKRTISKLISYIGSLLIMASVDYLIHFSKLLPLIGLDKLYGLPMLTCLVAIFLLIVEAISIREAADEKTKTETARVAQAAAKLVNKEELVDALTKAIINASKQKTNENSN